MALWAVGGKDPVLGRRRKLGANTSLNWVPHGQHLSFLLKIKAELGMNIPENCEWGQDPPVEAWGRHRGAAHGGLGIAGAQVHMGIQRQGTTKRPHIVRSIFNF